MVEVKESDEQASVNTLSEDLFSEVANVNWLSVSSSVCDGPIRLGNPAVLELSPLMVSRLDRKGKEVAKPVGHHLTIATGLVTGNGAKWSCMVRWDSNSLFARMPTARWVLNSLGLQQFHVWQIRERRCAWLGLRH